MNEAIIKMTLRLFDKSNRRTEKDHITDAQAAKKMVIFYSSVLFASLSLLPVSTVSHAETTLKNALDADAIAWVVKTNLSFSECIQKAALSGLDSHADIRNIAAQAVNTCRPVLDKLKAALDDQGIHPDFYNGTIEQVKNRAIRRLLPLLMMERSNQTH